MVTLLREMKKKHSSECEMFLNILQDPGMEELYEAATTMSAEEQTNRLLELRSKWFGLNVEHSGKFLMIPLSYQTVYTPSPV